MFRITIGHLLLATVMVAGMLGLVFIGESMATYLSLAAGFFAVRVGLGVRRFRQRGEPLQPVDLVVLVAGSLVVANLCTLAPGVAFYWVLLMLWGQTGSFVVNYAVAIGATLGVVVWLTDRFGRVGVALEPDLEKVLWDGSRRARPGGFRAEP